MIARDKQLHFIVGAGISATMLFLGFPPLITIIIVAIIGLLKELRDSLGYGTPEVADFVWTVIGGLFPMLILLL